MTQFAEPMPHLTVFTLPLASHLPLLSSRCNEPKKPSAVTSSIPGGMGDLGRFLSIAGVLVKPPLAHHQWTSISSSDAQPALANLVSVYDSRAIH